MITTDLVICRNKDANTAWTAASDGTLEDRSYLCQNWRADVSVIVGSSGKIREWVKYSAYGTPIGLPVGDTDSDGDCDGTDRSQVQTWINGSVYDVRGDVDFDGVVNSTDKSSLVASTLGRGVLSGTGVVNRKGYAGYEALSGLAGGKWLARNRLVDSQLGVWLRRDPVGYVDGVSLYAYCQYMPIVCDDPYGDTIVVLDNPPGSQKYIKCIVSCMRIKSKRFRSLYDKLHYDKSILVEIDGSYPGHTNVRGETVEAPEGDPQSDGTRKRWRNTHAGSSKVALDIQDDMQDGYNIAHELGHSEESQNAQGRDSGGVNAKPVSDEVYPTDPLAKPTGHAQDTENAVVEETDSFNKKLAKWTRASAIASCEEMCSQYRPPYWPDTVPPGPGGGTLSNFRIIKPFHQ